MIQFQFDRPQLPVAKRTAEALLSGSPVQWVVGGRNGKRTAESALGDVVNRLRGDVPISVQSYRSEEESGRVFRVILERADTVDGIRAYPAPSWQ